jgi:hypothetical protein
VIQASQAGSERCRIEVHEESGRISADLQVGDHLREVDGMESFDRFQLDDDAAVDQQIQLEPAADLLILVVKGEMPLAIDKKVFLSSSSSSVMVMRAAGARTAPSRLSRNSAQLRSEVGST